MVCQSVTGNACIGQAPTCAQIKAGDEKFGDDNGELCDDSGGYWLTPDTNSAFPISISASVAHLKEDPTAAVKGPTSNNHWHPFCNTVDGVERIHTFDSGEDYGTDTAKIWAGARTNAGCADFPGALPTTGFTTPTTGGGGKVIDGGGKAGGGATVDARQALPHSCWIDVLTSVAARTGGSEGHIHVSARVTTSHYGPAFADIDGFFLLARHGGGDLILLASNTGACVDFNASLVHVAVGAAHATVTQVSSAVLLSSMQWELQPLPTPSSAPPSTATAVALTVKLPGHRDVCQPLGATFQDGCISTPQPLFLREQRAPGSVSSTSTADVDNVWEWACPPNCPSGVNEISAPNATPATPPDGGTLGLEGLMFYDACSSMVGRTSTSSNLGDTATGNASSSSSSSVSSCCRSDAVLNTAIATQPQQKEQAASCEEFTTDPRVCLNADLARAGGCAFRGGDQCVPCSAHARCPGGARTWPVAGYWVSSETSPVVAECPQPSKERCLGMLHSGRPDVARQCGPEYKGPSCEQCRENHWESSTTGRCISCDGNTTGANGENISGGKLIGAITPILALLGGVVLTFLVVGVFIYATQHRNGGTLYGGLARARHFACYVIVLLQASLYTSNSATREVLNFFVGTGSSTTATVRATGMNNNVSAAVGAGVPVQTTTAAVDGARGEAEFIAKIFEAANIFQLDFSSSVRIRCFNTSPMLLEKTYLGFMFCIMFTWYASMAAVQWRLNKRLAATTIQRHAKSIGVEATLFHTETRRPPKFLVVSQQHVGWHAVYDWYCDTTNHDDGMLYTMCCFLLSLLRTSSYSLSSNL